MELIEVKGKRLKLKGICLVSCLLILASTSSEAQTFAEWFSQKKTQIKYLRQQIAALEQYGSDVKQGYQVAKNGWGGIGNWIKGEFDLHSAYYSSLKTVNPVIKNNPKADSIVTYAQLIPQQFDRLNGLSALDESTQDYIGRVTTAVLEETDKDLSELQLVMTDGKAQLTDDERIKRLDTIYARIRYKLTFSQSFCNEVKMFIVQRNQELQDIQTLGRYYEIN